jgi:3-isopropylmalate/(R)-2-methylmalate dehydratase small subunit
VNAVHRVWKLPADVDTDQLAPGSTMAHGIEVTAQHCLQALRPGFAAAVQRGDVIVAGPHFGIGSSREQAAAVLRHLGVAAVIAPSFSGLYFRNAFNLGLLLLVCAQAERLDDGEHIGFDAAEGVVLRENGERLPCKPTPAPMLELIRDGGLLAQLRRRFGRQRHPPDPAAGPAATASRKPPP